jgi:hypothetical protein
MTAHTDEMNSLREQLSAWMDGELSGEQARFLQRRLEHDAELRAYYERCQLVSASLKRQPLKLAHRDLRASVSAALAQETAPKKSRAWIPFAAAASVALALFVAYPQFQSQPASEDVVTADAAVSPMITVSRDVSSTSSPSLASADLVVDFSAPDPVADSAAPTTTPEIKSAAILASAKPARLPETLDIPATKPWPKATVVANDPSMDAMLIRHNQMADGQGMNGFVPYVDVIADDESIDELPATEAANSEEVRR